MVAILLLYVCSLSRQRSSELTTNRSSKGFGRNPTEDIKPTLYAPNNNTITTTLYARTPNQETLSNGDHCLPPLISGGREIQHHNNAENGNNYPVNQQYYSGANISVGSGPGAGSGSIFNNNNNPINYNTAAVLSAGINNHHSNNNSSDMSLNEYLSNGGRGGGVSLSGSFNTSTIKMSKFCHECGSRFIVDQAKFCIDCGVKRLVL